jgi:hypothetical protein
MHFNVIIVFPVEGCNDFNGFRNRLERCTGGNIGGGDILYVLGVSRAPPMDVRGFPGLRES